MSRERSANVSRERTGNSKERTGSHERSASKDREREKGGIAGLWNRLHPHSHPHTPEPETIREEGGVPGESENVVVGAGGGGKGAI